MTDFKVIGLSGFAGSGKDHIYRECLKPKGWRQFSLAWHFKTFLISSGIITYEEAYTNPKPEKVRHLLQIQGTELGRQLYGEQIWLNTAKVWMQTLHDSWGVDKFVIPDVRFWNELRYVQNALDGKVIWVDAPTRHYHSGLTNEQKLHASEAEMAEMDEQDFNEIIVNEPEYVPNIQHQMYEIFEKFGWKY